jgi:two-component system sensor histidine kinase HupT/HoxJ
MDGVDESTWLDVIQKMDEVYSQLVRRRGGARAEEQRAGTVAAVHLQRAVGHVGRAGGVQRARRIEQTNAALCELVGRSDDELRGTRLDDAAGRRVQRGAARAC